MLLLVLCNVLSVLHFTRFCGIVNSGFMSTLIKISLPKNKKIKKSNLLEISVDIKEALLRFH